MREVWLLCEGSDNSLDTRVIDALVIQRFSVNARVEPVEGDGSFGAVRNYLLRSSSHGPQPNQKIDRRILSVQDRNYQPVATAAGSWQVADQTKFIWHRHEIENYLLHPVAVKRALDALTGNQHPYQAPTDVDRLLISIGSNLAEHHAGMLLALQLEVASQKHRTKDFRQPIRIGQRRLSARATPPPSRAEWLAAIATEYRRLRRDLHRRRRVPALGIASLRREYDQQLAQVTDPQYLNSLTFLADFDGKGLISRLLGEFRSIPPLRRLTREILEAELLKQLDLGHADHSIQFQPDEFGWLGQRLNAAVTAP